MLPILRSKSYLPSFADDFFGRDFLSNFFDNETASSVPAVNVAENKNEFLIDIAVPGLDKEDFIIDLHNNLLTLRSEKENKSEEKEDKCIRREFSYASFKRSFILPDTADVDKISAAHKHGILHINIPKKEEAKEKPVRQIKVS
jgi:HSP20 family protein